MIQLLVHSIAPYVDSEGNAKIIAQVSAYYKDNTMPDTQEIPSIASGGNLLTVPYYGIPLLSVSAAYDCATIAQVFSQESHDERMIALNEFVISEAKSISILSRENLERLKNVELEKQSANYVCDHMMAMLTPEIVFPVCIPYE